jgi:hypothetical protein
MCDITFKLCSKAGCGVYVAVRTYPTCPKPAVKELCQINPNLKKKKETSHANHTLAEAQRFECFKELMLATNSGFISQ